MRKPDYSRSVFLNCPFDDAYEPLFEALVFAVMDCGFHIRCAKECLDGDRVRIHKLYELIRASRLGIHDLSRTETDPVTSLPRFNMPLELGIFLGAKYLGDEQQRRKQCLILDREKYRYQQYLSDVAGQDITTHNDDPRILVARVRDWLSGVADVKLPGGAILWDRYRRFKSELRVKCQKALQRPGELTFTEYVRYVDAFRPSKKDALILSDGCRIVQPSLAQIGQVLRRLPGGQDSFIIYAKSGSGLTYMQAIGDAEEGFELEYQEGDIDSHFACRNSALSLRETLQAFSWYAGGDERWRKKIGWEQIDI